MITAEERNTSSSSQSQQQQKDVNMSTSSHNIWTSSSMAPRCICEWKNCRTYQKAFREGQHPILDGVVRIRLERSDPEHMALKESIDKVLRVSEARRNDWKAGKRAGDEIVKYSIARHHYTEKHIQKYLNDPKNFSFTKPFSIHGAKKYLAIVDHNETIHDEVDGELLYLQCPNVQKEKVKLLCAKCKMNRATAPKEPLENSRASAVVEPEASHPVLKTSRISPAIVNDSEEADAGSVHRLRQKEEENARLKDQLESMQSQLTFLHHMVRKLQEEQYVGGNSRTSVTGDLQSGKSRSNRVHRPTGARRTYSARSQSARSGRSGVPREIELGDDDDETDTHWNEPTDGEWTETCGDDEDVEPSDASATFRVSYRASRRESTGSTGSAGTTKSRAKSVVSASKSVKSLPREIELEDDDSNSHPSVAEEVFEIRSFASSKISHGGVCSDDYGGGRGSNRGRVLSNHVRDSISSGGKVVHSATNSRESIGTSSVVSGSRHSYSRSSRRGSLRSGVRSAGDDASIASTRSGKSVTFDTNSQNGSGHGSSSHGAGTYQVASLVVTDPYGEKGTYTGSISNSTSMPHGSGRLEYDKAGRWYEGDWKHGRWTGYGRLSNGDGDFYEGGLKNDHKHGRGVMKFADGRTFVGEYVNGQMIEGKMTYQDGSTYAGSWVDGMRHGRGRCVFSDQSVYEGEFREGEFFGYGRMSWSDGGWYEGEWFNGEMHGRGKEVRPDNSLRHEGDWAKGQPIRH
jgi:hypothetical protein